MLAAARQQHITLDTIHITYLPDGYALFNPTFLFPTTTPADWQPYQYLLNQDGQLVASIGAYSIQTPSHTILVDAGYGPGQFVVERKIFLQGGELLASLERAGLRPTDIDRVFFTHLHSDHVRGISLMINELPFPNARYFARRAEWQRFANPEEPRDDVEDALRLLISLIVLPISAESNCIRTTAFAPIAVAFWTMRSIACRRASSSSDVYSLISPPPRERRPAMMFPQAPATHEDN